MRKLVASWSVGLIAIVVFAGCGSSSKSGGQPSSTAGGSSSSQLSQLVADAAKQKFKITYSTGTGSSETYAQDGQGNSMYGSGDSEFFVSKSATITCNKSSGSYTCVQSPVGGNNLGNPFLSALNLGETYLNETGDHLGEQSSKSIAGRDAECVTFSAKDLAGAAAAAAGAAGALKASATYCFDKQTGVTLEVSGTDASGKAITVLTVTSFQTPSAADFTPPAKPQAAPTLPSITLPGGVTIPTVSGGI